MSSLRHNTTLTAIYRRYFEIFQNYVCTVTSFSFLHIKTLQDRTEKKTGGFFTTPDGALLETSSFGVIECEYVFIVGGKCLSASLLENVKTQ